MTAHTVETPAHSTFRLSPAAGMFLARAVRAPLWLLVSALLARVLEPQGLGTWAMVLAAAMLGNQVLLLWTQSITQRFGRAEWLACGRLDETWATRWPALVAGMLVAGMLVALAPLDWHMRFYALADDHRWLVVPALLTLWLMSEAQGLQQVRERFRSLAWSPVAADLLMLATIALLALLCAGNAGTVPAVDTTAALLAIALAGVITWTAFLARELRDLPIGWQRPDRERTRSALLFSLPLVPGYSIGYVAEWCDYFLIGHFYGAPAVGLFHPAYQYMLILIGIPTAITAVLLPQVVTAMDNGGEACLRTLVTRTAPQLIVLWALGSLVVVAVLPELFAMLTGDAYRESRTVLQVLLVAVPGAIASHVYTLAHFAQGRLVASNLSLFGIKLAVNAGVSFALLPALGVVGSATGSAASYLILQWLFLADQHRHLQLPLGHGAAALALAHLAAIGLALLYDTTWRVAATLPAVVLIGLWARQAGLFSAAEVSAMMPRQLAPLLPFATRVLCRDA